MKKRDFSNNNKKKLKFPLNTTDTNFYKATQLYTGGEGIKKKTRKRGFKYMSNKPSPLGGALNSSGIRKSNTSVKKNFEIFLIF